jgi:hypothetical protein
MTLFTGIGLDLRLALDKDNKAVHFPRINLAFIFPRNDIARDQTLSYNKALLSIRSFAQRPLSYDDDQSKQKSGGFFLHYVPHV